MKSLRVCAVGGNVYIHVGTSCIRVHPTEAVEFANEVRQEADEARKCRQLLQDIGRPYQHEVSEGGDMIHDPEEP